MSKQILKLLFIFSLQNIYLQSILLKDQSNSLKQQGSKCAANLIESYIKGKSLPNGIQADENIQKYCPNIQQTCCHQEDLKSMIDFFIAKKTHVKQFYIESINKFSQGFDQFLQEMVKSIDQIDKNDKMFQCSNIQELVFYQQYVKKAFEYTSTFQNHLKNYEQKLFKFYSGFPCNLCDSRLENYFISKNDIFTVLLNYNQIFESLDLLIEFETVEKLFDYAKTFSKIGYCIKGEVIPQIISKQYGLSSQGLIDQASECKERIISQINGSTINNTIENQFVDIEDCIEVAQRIGIANQQKLDEDMNQNLEMIYLGFQKLSDQDHPFFKIDNLNFFPRRNYQQSNIILDQSINYEIRLQGGWDQINNTLDINLYKDQDVKKYIQRFIIYLVIYILFQLNQNLYFVYFLVNLHRFFSKEY